MALLSHFWRKSLEAFKSYPPKSLGRIRKDNWILFRVQGSQGKHWPKWRRGGQRRSEKAAERHSSYLRAGKGL